MNPLSLPDPDLMKVLVAHTPRSNRHAPDRFSGPSDVFPVRNSPG